MNSENEVYYGAYNQESFQYELHYNNNHLLQRISKNDIELIKYVDKQYIVILKDNMPVKLEIFTNVTLENLKYYRLLFTHDYDIPVNKEDILDINLGEDMYEGYYDE